MSGGVYEIGEVVKSGVFFFGYLGFLEGVFGDEILLFSLFFIIFFIEIKDFFLFKIFLIFRSQI
jgi:hypothetical protein